MNNRDDDDDDDDEIHIGGGEEAMMMMMSNNSERMSIDVALSSVYNDEEKNWNKQSIYGIYWFNKHDNKEAYEPLIVSIGPYHHGRSHLASMEVHKRRAVRHFIKRSNKSIEFYLKEMRSVEKEVREAYEHLDEKKWGQYNSSSSSSSSNQLFLQMIITDGCFILEFMEILSGAPKDYASNDPVFSYYGSIAHYNVVMRDLLLLENQLPYLVLKKLLVIADRSPELTEENAEAILSQMMMFPRDAGPGAHMLDMYMRGMFKGYKRGTTTTSSDDNNNNNNNGSSSEAVVQVVIPPTATLLSEAGITFKRARSFDEISFNEQTRTLYLPQLNIDDYTISTLMNLKMFELRGTTDRHFNSYISMMRALMKSASDVRVLMSEGIVVNLLRREDEEVLKLVKQLAEDAVVDEMCPSFVAQHHMCDFYKESMRQWENELRRQMLEWLSNLHQTYFRTPWSTISVLAAAVLLLLTVIQALYSIKSYVSK
ncbi:hypothetical protein Syun_024665 [Stephania yunnanensis]|uniref:Uncharacterized protein n=1 Tax=Stephania yunnanensis TaxID=152371 RepID=A0AAP0NIY1_9MAGN